MTTLIAHRGASSEAPENTIKAIKRAIELRVECIEMDLHLTKDGIPVVVHDSALTRTTNIKEAGHDVEQLTLNEVKELDAGSWFSSEFAGEKIPTLQEVLELERHGTKLMLEIKKGALPADELTARILSFLPEEDASIIVGSFEPEIVRSLQDSKYALIGIIEEVSYIQTFLDMGLKHLAIWSRILDPRLMDYLQREGVIVWTFTVDDIQTANLLRSLGVDGIITNDPQGLSNNVNKKGLSSL